MGKIQSGVKPPQSKKEGSGLIFWSLEAGGRAAHLFSIHPDTSAAEFKTIQPFFNGGG
jgi:hypothetical protein